jgi:hypothetical protein
MSSIILPFECETERLGRRTALYALEQPLEARA